MNTAVLPPAPPVLPSTAHCTVLARSNAAAASIELRRFAWNGLHEAVCAAADGYLELTRVRSRARYLEVRGMPMRAQGDVRYVPAQRAFYCRWEDDLQEALQCALDIPRLIGEPLELPQHRLPETLDLQDGMLQLLLTRMREELLNPGLASEALLASLSVTAAITLLRRFSPSSRASSAALPQRLRGERLEARHLAELVMRLREDGLRPRLDTLAAQHGLSPRHYGRLFKAAAGQGFASFMAAQTTQFAQDLLRDLRRPVKEVALRCGFADTAAFSKAFRKATGHAPQVYRDQHRQRTGP